MDRAPDAVQALAAQDRALSFLGAASYSATIRSLYSGLKVRRFGRGAGSGPAGLVLVMRGWFSCRALSR